MKKIRIRIEVRNTLPLADGPHYYYYTRHRYIGYAYQPNGQGRVFYNFEQYFNQFL